MIKILLVDDQKILLEGLVKILAPLDDIKVVGTCTLSELAEEACIRLAPDLVLMDICMEGRTSGIQICTRLKKQFPNLRIVLMTGMQEVAFLEWAKDAGADSFIYKESSGEAFAACIRATMEGRRIYPSAVARCALGGTDNPLTERELAILQRICRNMNYDEIADELGITKRTVNFHIGNMLAKTGYKSIVGLAVEATERGYAGSAP
ncbi:response regulator transcription factor [uncultured Selenomonas sp.]|uniref:response regulator transcription factor n=1 Tax=uncultured Selenomonas sp. TaxID=159275 RepID=UPI0028E5752E|nr:response regulator transcription factor [uncultured Selenomonas sp.]